MISCSKSFLFLKVEIADITTGASVLVEGIVVSSQGAKQKVELKVARLNVVCGFISLLISESFMIL